MAAEECAHEVESTPSRVVAGHGASEAGTPPQGEEIETPPVRFHHLWSAPLLGQRPNNDLIDELDIKAERWALRLNPRP